MTIGFDRPLYILPFDHLGSFQTVDLFEQPAWRSEGQASPPIAEGENQEQDTTCNSE